MSEPEPVTTWRHDSDIGGTVWMEANEEGRIKVWHETMPGLEPDHILDAVRGAAWMQMQIPRNPGAALYQYAQKRGLGAPVTSEFDFIWQGTVYRAQGYAMGIVYCEVGAWDHVQAVLW